MSLDLHRVRGAVLCAAVGDALGRPVKAIEVTRRLQFKYGREAPSRLSYSGAPPALITDETQQSLFMADGLIRHLTHEIPRTEAIRKALMAWKRTQAGPGGLHRDGWLAQQSRLYFRRLPERTTELAIDALDRGEHPTRDAPINDSAGPTATTRSLPYAIALPTASDAFTAAFEDAALTHGDPLAQLAAGAYARLLHDLLRGIPLGAALDRVTAQLQESEGLDGPIQTVIQNARHVAAGGPCEPHHLEAMGDARTAPAALAIALCCAMTLEDTTAYGFVRAMWRSVCHGGSSDTTGFLTGGLLGALLGVESIPHPWLIDLEMIEVLEKVARDLYSVGTGRSVDPSDYPI